MGWLQDYGLAPDSVSPASDLLTVRMSLEKANSLLSANYSAYVHQPTNTTIWRTLSYSVPADVDQHLSVIYPTTQFIPPPISPPLDVPKTVGQLTTLHPETENQAASCAKVTTPRCLQALYNIPSDPATADGSGIAVSGLADQVANPDDLKMFLAQERPDFKNASFAVLSVNGQQTETNGTASTSASMAVGIQYVVGLANGVPTTIVYPSEQDGDSVQGLLDIANFLLAQDTPPRVLLTNIAFDEAAFAQAPEVAQHLCNAYAQLGARGTSVIVASGSDHASETGSDASCDSDAPRAMFPATCPYVTSVGGTQGLNPETAAEFSSGGFSNIFPRPDYQRTAVDGYFKQVGNATLSTNTTGRAYPDVSAQGSNFTVLVDGQAQTICSTSASSATFAAVVALLNDRLIGSGKSPLGFLNPLLYSNATSAFNDVLSGSAVGCGASGLSAATGWDPATGLGTPDFKKLLAVVTKDELAGAGESTVPTAASEGNPRSISSREDPTAEVIRGPGLENLFPFTASGLQEDTGST